MRLYFCLVLSWNLVMMPSRSFAQALPAYTPSDVFPSFVNDLVSSKLQAMKSAGTLANAANDNIASLASKTASAIEAAGASEIGVEGGTWLGLVGAAALPEIAVGGAVVLGAVGAYGAYKWIKQSDDLASVPSGTDLSPVKAPKVSSSIFTSIDKSDSGLSGLVTPVGANYSYSSLANDPDPAAHTIFYDVNQPMPAVQYYTVQEPVGCGSSIAISNGDGTCYKNSQYKFHMISYDPITEWATPNYYCSDPAYCAQSEFWSFSNGLLNGNVVLKNISVTNNVCNGGSVCYLFSFDEYALTPGTSSLTKIGSSSQTITVSGIKESAASGYPDCGYLSVRVGESCTATQKDQFEIGDPYEATPLQLGKAVPADQAGTAADPSALANLVNDLWQKASAASDYAGVAYPSSDPLTSSDVSSLQSSSDYPHLGDLADFAPSSSPSTGGSTSPSTGGSTSPSTGGSTSPSTGGSTDPDTSDAPSVPKPDDPTSPLISDILDPIFGMFPGLTKFTVPSQSAACPKLEITVFGKDISSDTHCQLIEANKDTIATISAVVYAAISLLIILSA